MSARTTRLLLYCFAIIAVFCGLPKPIRAEEIATNSASVTATVPVLAPPGTDSIAPAVPILLRPADNAVTSDTTPEFVWRQVEDPNSNYVAYTVYIDGEAVYLGVSSSGNAAKYGAYGYTSMLYDTEVRLIPSSALAEGTHTWQVAAYDMSGNHSFSTVWTFVIDTTPPPVTVTDIDSHHGLSLSSLDPDSISADTIFDVTGSKEVPLTVRTETYTTIHATFTSEDGTLYGPAVETSGDQTSVTIFQHLDIGTYIVEITATDHANLVTVLPSFRIRIVQPGITVPFPGLSPAPSFPLPDTLTRVLYNYPATIARITSRDDIAFMYLAMLAVAIGFLLILLKKRSNLILLNRDGSPIRSAIVTVRHTRKKYSLIRRDYGRLYIPELTARTELTIETEFGTYALCLLYRQRQYTITF